MNCRVRVLRMRTGIVVTISPACRRRLQAVVGNRTSPQKHVWRAKIVLLYADGAGISEIMRRTGTSKTCAGAGRNTSWRKASVGCCVTSRDPRESRRSGRHRQVRRGVDAARSTRRDHALDRADDGT